MNTQQTNGHLLLLMAPSGSGKKTVMDGALSADVDMYFAKTFTTRAPREGAAENPRYNFISQDEFQAMIDNNQFIEYAEFGGNFYGTPKSEIIDPLEAGRVVFKEMELQGIQQIKELIPEHDRTIVYIDGGPWADLEKRIKARAPISDEELELRRQRYEEESKAKGEANIIIENFDGMLDSAIAQMKEVIASVVESNK